MKNRPLLQRLRDRVPLGVDSHALWQLVQSLHGEGVAPVRVLVLEPRLLRAVRQTGCAVVAEEAAGERVDALFASHAPPARRLPAEADATAELSAALRGWAQRVRPGGVVVLCSRLKQPRTQLCAAFLHAGLTELTQTRAGRYLLTAGRTLPPLPASLSASSSLSADAASSPGTA